MVDAPLAPEPEFIHDRLTTWEQGEAGGNVSEEPSPDFPVRVVGYARKGRAPDAETYELNKPLYITKALAKQLLSDAWGKPDGYERLEAGQVVHTWANEYRLVNAE